MQLHGSIKVVEDSLFRNYIRLEYGEKRWKAFIKDKEENFYPSMASTSNKMEVLLNYFTVLAIGVMPT